MPQAYGRLDFIDKSPLPQQGKTRLLPPTPLRPPIRPSSYRTTHLEDASDFPHVIVSVPRLTRVTTLDRYFPFDPQFDPLPRHPLLNTPPPPDLARRLAGVRAVHVAAVLTGDGPRAGDGGGGSGGARHPRPPNKLSYGRRGPAARPRPRRPGRKSQEYT
eukprot:1188375-Prorocentrum_minimum.AAC.5